MPYKAMVLRLLEDCPQIYEKLCEQKMLLRTMEFYASQLKALHEGWKERLAESKPGSDESQIASEALEMALQEVKDSLPPELPQNEDEPLALDAAMAFLRRHTLPA